MTRLSSSTINNSGDNHVPIDIQCLINLTIDEQLDAFHSVSDVSKFCGNVLSFFMREPSLKSLGTLINLFLIHGNSALHEEYLEYFSLPIFINLSTQRLEIEQENSANLNFTELLANLKLKILSSGSDDEFMHLKTSFLPSFINFLISCQSVDIAELGIEFLKIILIQPSCRRFVKPYLEDMLLITQLKQRSVKIKNVVELEKIYFYPIDDNNGVPYPCVEDYIKAHSTKVSNLQKKVTDTTYTVSLFYQVPTRIFASPRELYATLKNLSVDDMKVILGKLGCASFPNEIPHSALVEAICNLTILRIDSFVNLKSALPDEVTLVSEIDVIPVTVESLSAQELFIRHAKLLQKTIYHELKLHIDESIKSCCPVLNRESKIEFSSWTRDAIEVVSAAITRVSEPDLKKGGVFQRIELEASVSLAPLDTISKKSWVDLKKSEIVFLCYIGSTEDGSHKLNMMRTAFVESRSSKNNILTFTLLMDPDNFEYSQRQHYSKFNLIIKRGPSESNDMRVLKSLNTALVTRLPEHFEDAILGLENPNDISYDLNAQKVNLTHLKLSESQIEAVSKCSSSSLSICIGPFGSGCTTTLLGSVFSFFKMNTNSLVIFRSSGACDKFYSNLLNSGIPDVHILRLGFSSTLDNVTSKYRAISKSHIDFINCEILAKINLIPIYSCIEAEYVLRSSIMPLWETFQILLKSSENRSNLVNYYPFATCLDFCNEESFESHFKKIHELFKTAKLLAPLESLESNENISKYVLQNLAKVVVLTSKYVSINALQLADLGFNFDNMLVDDCNLIPEIELLLAMSSQSNPSKLEKVALFGHPEGGRPFCNDATLGSAGCSVTLMDRFMAAGFSNFTSLSHDSSSIRPWNLWKSTSKMVKSDLFDCGIKFVSVSPILGPGEECPSRNYLQNLDEAEYAVALYQLLRLNHIPADKIAILSAYKGQVELIKEVIETRCSWTDFYAQPAYNGTIDQSHGLEFEYVIISLVRTKFVGFLSDANRIELALTRASKNVVILGSQNLFRKYFDLIIQKFGTKLSLSSGKSFENVEDLTHYVYGLSLEKLS